MCGRFALVVNNTFYKRFSLNKQLDDLLSRYNITPGQDIPIITRKTDNELELAKWGLVPHWAKDPKIGYKMINARAETILEKPSFKKPFLTQRCLVPASGFYEWETTTKGKPPYYIQLKTQDHFAFAGVYDIWQTPERQELKTCTIITTAANQLISSLHERMPVILPPEAERIWLDNELRDPGVLLDLLKPYPENAMQMHQLESKKINEITGHF